MTYKLYARPGSGSAAVEGLLAITGSPVDVIDVPKMPDGSSPAWYLAINPRGEVPSLQLPDGSIMTESAAMMIHIADCTPGLGLAPAINAPLRPQFLRWMIYLAAAAYPTDLRLYYPDRYSTDASHAPAIRAKAVIDLNRDFDVFALGMGPGPFILGDKMSAADIYAAMLISWSDDVPGLFARHPKLKRLYGAVAGHPAIAPVWQRNGMP
jgi:glutathione S-transferase